MNDPINNFDILGLSVYIGPYPYTANNGRKAHEKISDYIKHHYQDKYISPTNKERWKLHFDTPLKKIFSFWSLRKPDIINESCPKLIWEIKPIRTHLKNALAG